MAFVKRQLIDEPQTLGKKLRELRKGKAVSLEMLQEATRIQRKYLLALEHDRYEELPEPLYVRNFLRAYARVLEADEAYFLELYEEENGRCDLIEPLITPKQRLRKMKLFIWDRAVVIASMLFVGLLVFVYLGMQIFSITNPPEVFVISPVDEMITQEAIVQVEGFVQGEATIFVNGEQVVLDEEGNFLTMVDLDRGLNIISIEAERRYSRRSFIERKVVFNPKERIFGPILSTP